MKYSLCDFSLPFSRVLFFFKKMYWRIVDLQCFISRCTASESVVHIHGSTLLFFKFFSHRGHYRVWSSVPWATQHVLISYPFCLSVRFSHSDVSDFAPAMDCSTPGFPVRQQLPELSQTHVHWVSNAIQPSHPLSPPSPAFNLAQHQDLFQWVSSLHQVAKVLELQLQHHSFQWIFRTDFP